MGGSSQGPPQSVVVAPTTPLADLGTSHPQIQVNGDARPTESSRSQVADARRSQKSFDELSGLALLVSAEL